MDRGEEGQGVRLHRVPRPASRRRRFHPHQHPRENSTKDFVAIHFTKATKMLDKFYVGDLDPATVDDAAQVEEDRVCERTGRKVRLDTKHTRSFTMQKKTVLSRDLFELDFALQTLNHVLDLPTGSTFSSRGT